MADDTLEIREVHQANNGRDPFPILVSRQRMPKHLVPKTYPSVEKEIVSGTAIIFRQMIKVEFQSQSASLKLRI